MSDYPNDPALPGEPVPAPEARALPSDVVTLDGPVPEDPLELVPRLTAALSRPGPAVVVATSGSTGRPKKTVLSTQALTASGRATERATAGPGQWLLCLPAHYVAGIQVLARSVLAGTRPVAMPTEHFTPAAFADAAQRLTHPVRYVSVVPTQLQRILDPRDGAPDPRAVAALARFDAVLVGGSALYPDLAARAADEGVHVVRTYGMSETCGGCVYDDAALDAVTAGIVPDGAPSSAVPDPNERREGRIWLGGTAVADGYLDDPAQTADHFRVIGGVRWYRTDDLGVLREDGTLRVLGRTDDVINTGGVKVSAGLVAAELQRDERVRQALVLAVPHPEWGQAVAALIALREGSDLNAVERELSSAIRDGLGAPAVPKLWRHVAQLPMLATGKPDRRSAEALFASPDV
ncbi:O-succinylbenzoic acid--CoA ligase [Kocuria marina subsp. indica]|uniref:AMP-binding protein n=1 Tax=Kocuria TaxID=57493 RepID=UPI00103A4569|nr:MULTISPECIES: AMP-binding protein [Kocuria]MDT0119107.1 AMP-binding protein [Kocuria sp. PD6]QBJ20842.1 O-succinylbenzoic acid--CoA ligase [Kocuria indica]